MSAWIGIGRSDIGLVRAMNQDAFVTMDSLGFWAVADGMGGHAGGEVAAQSAIATVAAQAESFADRLRNGSCAPQNFLRDMIAQAHEAVLNRARLEPRLSQMGTTLVALLIIPGATPTAHLAHVGDSRGYLFRDGRLTLLTRDHTLIEDYLTRGIVTLAEAKTHPERHVLMRAIGITHSAEPDYSAYPLLPSDVLLLCSDGLTKMLDDADIADIMARGQSDPIRICDRLIETALARGGEDNVTVVAIARP
ncbi:MAG: PPM-type phosphatase domain-containing protein [Nitrospira sp.]|nr:MAG: PPM-type phosphatase domain-containing protein [Nitrospira sp.]